jgi:oligoribonuclease NrnB/cAMP/cGMP phosphodiesterase (DHH superfamily)
MKELAMEYVLYHENCDDGFGAAWTAWQALGDRARYIPVQHGEPPPEIPDGSTLTIVDFAYPRDVLIGLKERLGSLWVLDHHKTAAKDLAGLDFTTFDMEKSGAMLAWDHWFPGEPAPPLLQYIQDRDLWLFQLPNSPEVSAALRSYPRDFPVWSTLSVDVLARDGIAIQRARGIQVSDHVKLAALRNVGGYLVPVVNATCYLSDIGDQLNANYPDSPFAACYFDRADGRRQWSLRSRGEFDVSEVAERFGGGGHRNVAGYTEESPGSSFTTQ